jgi:hypothetical protein
MLAFVARPHFPTGSGSVHLAYFDSMDTSTHSTEAANRLARQLARRAKLINWSWLVLSLFLLGTGFGIIAAAWNAYITFQRWKLPALIERRSRSALAAYSGEPGTWITWLLINVVLGGFVGAGIIAYDYFFVRAAVLKNRHLFDQY